MATPYNPFQGPLLNGSTLDTQARPQAAPAPAPYQPQQVPGIGEFLAGLAQAYGRQGLAAPGHGVNQNIADRQRIEGEAAANQRSNFNAAFPQGRGENGLMSTPQFDPQQFQAAEMARRAGGDTRQVGTPGRQVADPFDTNGAPLGGVDWNNLAAPVSAPSTARGADFIDPSTGMSQGLVNPNLPDASWQQSARGGAQGGGRYGDANTWTAQGGRSPNQTGPRQGAVISQDGQSQFNAPAPQQAQQQGPVTSPQLSAIGDYLAQHGAGTPKTDAQLGVPPVPGMPYQPSPTMPQAQTPATPFAPPTQAPPLQASLAQPSQESTTDANGYVDYRGYPRWQAPVQEPGQWAMNFWNWLNQPQGSNR